MSEKTTKTGTLAGRPQTQSARPWRTLGRSNAPITCYSASGVKLGQEITARAYIVELELCLSHTPVDSLIWTLITPTGRPGH